MIFNLTSGGSAAMNMKVVGGTTQPSNPLVNTIWANTGTPISSWVFSSTEPGKRSANENLIVYPFDITTSTVNGITYTDNGDGTITANGTATASAYFIFREQITLGPGTYTLSGNDNVIGDYSSNSGYRIIMQSLASDGTVSTEGTQYSDWGGGSTFTLTQTLTYRIACVVHTSAGAVSNIIFKPRLEKSSSASFIEGPVTGQLWFETGTSSEFDFNALKKNVIQIYPKSAKQYIDGEWTNINAYIYRNGQWEQFSQNAVLPVLNPTYPTNVTNATAGGSATFKVVIETPGVPATYTYQWYVNDNAVSGATSATYTRSNLTAGTYNVYCKVTNAAGTVQSRTATMTIVQTLTIVPNTATYGASAWQSIERTPEKTVNSTNAIFTFSAGSKTACMVYVPIDVTEYSTMKIVGNLELTNGASSGNTVMLKVGLFNGAIGSFATGYSKSVAYKGTYPTINNTYDISSLSGTKWFGFYHLNEASGSFESKCTLTSVIFS